MSGSSPQSAYRAIFSNPTPIQPKRGKRIWPWVLLGVGIALSFFTYRCTSSVMKTVNRSDIAVASFHKDFNSSAYQAIYEGSDERFQRSGKEEELLKFFGAVHTKLGNARNSVRQNYNVNATTNGTFAYVVYSTTFDKGSALETFTWLVVGSDLKLVGYNVNSRELIAK